MSENKTVIYQLPKRLNELDVPREVRWNGVIEGIEYKKKCKIIDHNNIAYTKQQYEKIGIIIKGEHDDLFWDVELPKGWKIEQHGIYMSCLYDEKGRIRSDFFYKAAHYDSCAFSKLYTRFHSHVTHTATRHNTDYSVWIQSDYQGVVEDGDTIIFQTERIPVTRSFKKDDMTKEKLKKKLETFMTEHYPDYQDIHAYWDEEIEKELD